MYKHCGERQAFVKKEFELILRAIVVAILAASLAILFKMVPWGFFMARPS
jgi:hypothetical protein